jgi:hypothetical protein
MCDLTVDFWRGVLQLPVIECQNDLLKEGFWPTSVYRVRLEYANAAGPRTVILKCARPEWMGDARGAEREVRVYSELLPHIGIPQPKRLLSVNGGETAHSQLVLQDLEPEYIFYPETYQWSPAQGQAILRTLARLHVEGCRMVQDKPRYLMPPTGERWSVESATEMFRAMSETPWLAKRLVPAAPLVNVMLADLPTLRRDAADEPKTLVHYDIYPPNIAFSRSDANADAVLIDWALATRDLAEVDLAFLFQQPYQSDARLDWRAALRYYWRARGQLTGESYDWDKRVRVLRLARIQAWFTSLVPIHRAWEKAVQENVPFDAPEASPFAKFYDALLTDMVERLPSINEMQ